MRERVRRPAFQFYPADWRKDPELQSCSLEARGLWIECMCIMHEATPYGHLVVNGRPVEVEQLARLVGNSATKTRRILSELRDAGVYEVTPENVICSRRMVQDEHNRNVRAAGGCKSLSNPAVPRPKDGGKDTLPPSLRPSLGGSPSSSSSASATTPPLSPSDEGERPRRRQKARGPVPDDWTPNDAHRIKAREKALDVEEEAEAFRNHHRAKGSLFADPHAAFHTWLRNADRFTRAARPAPSLRVLPSQVVVND